ncbi:MAG: hypothetical protein Q9216_002005 [Gyalolechia sp. 2 TL-2023]
MTPTPAVTHEERLIAVLNSGIARFSREFAPLDKREDKQLLRASKLASEDPAAIIHGNNARKKSRRILVDLLSISRKVFFLCAIGTTLDALRKLRSQTYVHAVSTWWSTVAKPGGLETAMKLYGLLIPSIQASNCHTPPTPPEEYYASNSLPIISHAMLKQYCFAGHPCALPAHAEGLSQAMVHPAAPLPEGGTRPQPVQSLTMSLYTVLQFLKENYADEVVQIDCPFDERSLPSIQFGSPKADVKMELGHAIAFKIMKHGMDIEKMQQGQSQSFY